MNSTIPPADWYAFLVSNVAQFADDRLKEIDIREICFPKFEFSESLTCIKTVLKIDGIENLPKNLIKVYIQKTSIEVKIRTLELEDTFYYFKIDRLANEIIAENSSFKITKGTFTLLLLKVKPVMWDTICYYDPEVVKKYLEKINKYVMSNPILERRLHILLNFRILDLYSCIGHDVRSYLYSNDFSDKINTLECKDLSNPEEIVECFNSNLTDSSLDDQFAIFAYAVYFFEKQKMEHSYEDMNKQWPGRSFHIPSKLKSENKEAEDLKQKGDRLFKAKNFTGAVDAFTEAIKLDPKCSVLYLNRSISYLYMGNNFESTLDAAEALTINPFYGKAYFYLGKACLLKLDLSLSTKCLFLSKTFNFENSKLLDDEIDKLFLILYNIDMYINAVKLGNDINKSTYVNFIFESRLNADPFIAEYVLKRNICKADFNCYYIFTIRGLIIQLCVRGMTSHAKLEAKVLTRHPAFTSDAFLYLFLGLCNYFEDNEGEVRLNFTKVKEFPFFLQINKAEAIFCNAVEKSYSARSEGNRLYDTGKYEEAIKWYMKAIHYTAGHVTTVLSAIFYKIARAKLKLNQHEESLVYINKAIEGKDDYHEAITFRGEYFLRQGKFINALNNFEKAYNLHPCDRYKEMINMAKLKQSSSFYDDESLCKEISLQKSLAKCKKERGNKHFTNKHFEEAIDAYSEAIELDPTNPVYFSNRAACYIELKNFCKGLTDCEKALELDSSFLKGLYRSSKCFIALGKPNDAIEALEKALKIKPSDKDLLEGKFNANCLKNEIMEGKSANDAQNFEIAEQILSSALLKAEGCLDLRLKRIDCLINLKKFDKALTEADLAGSLDSDNSELFYYKGICHFYNLEKDKSIDCLKKSLELKSEERVVEFCKSVENVFSLKELGDKAYEENRYKEALSYYEEGFRLDSKNKKLNSDFHFKIGIIYMKESNMEKAIEHFSFVINLRLDKDEAYKLRADCYLALNLLDKALQDYEDLYKLVPNNEYKAVIRETKAKIEILSNSLNEEELETKLSKCKQEKADKYFSNNNFSGAIECYTAALHLSKNSALYLSRSACYMAIRNYHTALSDANEALKRDVKCLKGLLLSGECHILLGNATEAISAFEQAKKFDERNKDFLTGLQKAKKLKQCLDNAEAALKNKAIGRTYDMFKCASRIAVGSSSILLSVAECLISLHRLPALSKLIESVDESLKKDSDFFCMKGLEAYHKDEMLDTIKYLERALEVDPSNEKYSEYLRKVRLVYEKKQKGNDAFFKEKYNEALQHYKEGLKMETGNIIIQSKFHYNIGVVLKKQNLLTEAIEKFTWAISLRETYINALEKRAKCYEEVKERDKAITDYRNLYEITKSEKYLKHIEKLKKPQNKRPAKKEYYNILKVSTNASMEEIRKSYKALAKEYHPDRLSSKKDKEIGEEKFKEINEAYSVLIDPLKRERFDRGVKEEEFNSFQFHPFWFNIFRQFHQERYYSSFYYSDYDSD